MSNWRMWAFILTAPLLGLLVFGSILAVENQNFRDQLAQLTQIPADVRQSLTIARYCAIPEVAGSSGCQQYKWISLLFWTSTGTLLFGLLIPAVIRWAGRRSRTHRRLLLKIFAPGLKLAVMAVACLIILHAILLVAALYFGPVYLFSRYAPKLLFLIGAGACVGVWKLIASLAKTVTPAEAGVFGRVLPATEHPALWGMVRDLASRAGASPPDHIVGGLDGTFFVTEAKVHCLDGPLTGRTLFLSLPLCRIMTIPELEGVIGHELGHFLGEDTQYSLKFYPIYRGAQESIEVLLQPLVGGAWVSSAALLPALSVLGFFMDSFSEAECEISRTRELAADATAVRLTSPSIFGAALVKVAAFAEQCVRAADSIVEDVRARREPASYGSHIIRHAGSAAATMNLGDLDTVKVPHPTDSHPPLGVRLQAMGVSLDGCRQQALDVNPEISAFSLFESGAEVEESLTGRIRESAAKQGSEVEPPAFATLPD